MEKKYPNYEKLAAYLNTLDNPQQVLQIFAALCKPISDSLKRNGQKP